MRLTALGASDAATVNLVDTETIIWGAGRSVWNRLKADSPGQEFGNYDRLNREAVAQYNYLSRQNIPEVDHKIGFDSPWEGRSRWGLNPLNTLGDWY